MEFNEKRPERVLEKSGYQELSCPSCQKTVHASSNQTIATCSCGQVINWGLRK